MTVVINTATENVYVLNYGSIKRKVSIMLKGTLMQLWKSANMFLHKNNVTRVPRYNTLYLWDM